MYSFENDYSEGAHENIITALAKTNREQTSGYAQDEYCVAGRTAIARLLNNPQSQIHFLVGGTQANTTVISAILRPHQGVIAASSGHIAIHESGAVEATGHKVLTIESQNGKITAHEVERLIRAHYDDPTYEHMVQPGMVYISDTTEVGTIYTKAELSAMYAICQKYNVPLFIDGARLGCALTCAENDLTLADIARLCDVFYIGGTKNGALFGEAVVINNPIFQKDFRYHQKQRGGMFAKGRVLGIQFYELFKDGLYFELATHANRMAEKISGRIAELGYSFFAKSPTNQVFPIFPKSVLAELSKKYRYALWTPHSETHDVIRLCTSWATEDDKVDEFLQDLTAISNVES